MILPLAVVVQLAVAHRDHLGLLGFFFGRIGNDDAAADFLRRLGTLHKDSIAQWFDLHLFVSLRVVADN